jgi:Flp pilus assembly protein TadG
MTWLAAYHTNRSGAVVVEAAFVLPFLILLTFGAVDSSMLMLQNHKMETGLTAAGNYLARTGNPQSYETRAKRLAVTGDMQAGGKSQIAGWKTSDVTIAYQNISNLASNGQRAYRGSDNLQIIRLSSEFDYQGIGLLRAMSGGELRLKALHEERVMGRG